MLTFWYLHRFDYFPDFDEFEDYRFLLVTIPVDLVGMAIMFFTCGYVGVGAWINLSPVF